MKTFDSTTNKYLNSFYKKQEHTFFTTFLKELWRNNVFKYWSVERRLLKYEVTKICWFGLSKKTLSRKDCCVCYLRYSQIFLHNPFKMVLKKVKSLWSCKFNTKLHIPSFQKVFLKPILSDQIINFLNLIEVLTASVSCLNVQDASDIKLKIFGVH